MSILELDRLSHNFGQHWALRDISLTLEQGQFLFLTGPSGAGKTTLLRILYGALPVHRGRASICGFDMRGLRGSRLPALRRQLGVVFQDFKILMERSVYDNVAIALQVRGMARLQIERRVRAVLRSLNLDKRADARCDTLSGGEQQRVAIARAIVVNPRILLADEPSGNLDPKLSLRLMEIFKHFNAHGTTVILATHSPELLACNPKARILHLEQGAVVGTH
jgi:cell division transport system ATP-binding protein